MKVPFVDLGLQRASIAADLDDAVRGVMESGAFIGGPDVAAFEREFAGWVGVEHAVGVANGTDALEVALRAMGVQAGDEVIVPAATFIATAEAVVAAGGVPVFVDVQPGTFTMDPHAAEAAITERTTAVVPVHLYGRLADMDALGALAAQRGLAVVEDASQAHGAARSGTRAGAFGTAATFSFYPSKNLGAAGDAGAVVTRDVDVADAARRLANHGGTQKDEHVTWGRNSRLDTIQAAILRVKLSHIDDWNAQRRTNAAIYSKLLAGLEGIALPTPAGEDHVWHVYNVLIANGRRDEVREFLGAAGISTGVHYPLPVHLTPAFTSSGAPEGSCPVAESLSSRALSLPMFPELTEQQVAFVADALGSLVTT